LLLWLYLFPQGRILITYLKVRRRLLGVRCQSASELFHRLCLSLAWEANISVDKARIFLKQRFYPRFVHAMINGSKPFTGVQRCLDVLQKNKIPIGVLSDFDGISPRLRALGLDPSQFTFLKSAESSGALKPHPDLVADFPDLLGVALSEILFVGDRDDTDAELCRRTGMHFLPVNLSASHQWWDRVGAEIVSRTGIEALKN